MPPIKRAASCKKIQEDILSCSIHLGTLERPRVLPCGHNLCENCLKDFLSERQTAMRRNLAAEVTCPLCRKVINISDGGIGQPQTTVSVMDGVTKVVISVRDGEHIN
ncbi:TRI59-like protein [Mya arenaria]|uniref:TRI59-like protein n=1 Tax=Mya arenaria TaxID=6604 RepID=A0ABY7DBM2_MYAAR|nr:TRI59-like protein [Mya arenaria]